VSAATQAAHPEIPWREITGMRHRLIHGYGDVRLDLVWIVLCDRLPPLLANWSNLRHAKAERAMGRSRASALTLTVSRRAIC
jgi:uncharacterized protein with HEPN domain